jgi:hypothetical protein
MDQKNIQFTVRLPKIVADELQRHIDGEQFRNRQHAFLVIINDWLSSQRNKRRGEQTNIMDLKPPKRGKERKKP